MVALFLVALLAVEAPVTSAVVYSGQARVTRTAEAAVSGHTAVELPLLPREADPDSVRVEVSGAQLESVEVARLGPLSLRVEEARKVVAALERIDDELALARAEDSALAEAAGTGDRAPEAPDDETSAWAGLDPARWRQTLGFLRGWRERLDQRRARISSRVGPLQLERQKLVARAAVLSLGDEGRVRVVVHLGGQGRARVRASYLVDGPTWLPRYEVRLDPQRDEVSVGLGALASQETGDDWTGTALTFSTAIPTSSTAAPELPRWLIGERERFIPETTARPEASPPPPTPPPPAASSDLADLRARLLAAADMTVIPTKAVFTNDGFNVAPTGRQAVKELLTQEVQTAGYGADPSSGITGYVFDQTGNPIKGVKVVAVRPGVPAKSAYTNDEGLARFRDLPPGRYEVRASAPRLKTVIQNDVSVGKDAAAEVTLIMEVATAGVEEVKVVEKAPLVSTTSAHVKESYDASFVSAATSSTSSRFRPTISLAPPEATYRRPRLAPGLAAALAGGHELAFPSLGPESLASGAMAQRVPLGSWRWPVSLRRQLYPAVRPEAYLVASLRMPASTVLPAGDATLFVDGQPVGKAHLDLTRPGQQFTLPLGSDRAVRSRRQVKLESHEQGLIDRDEVSRYTVTIDVANPHRRGVALDVFDQLPSARDGSVAVKLESSAPPVKVDPEGLLTWHTGVAAGKTIRLRFVYTLTRPRGNRLKQEEARR